MPNQTLKIRASIYTAILGHRNLLLAASTKDDNQRILEIGIGVGQVASYVHWNEQKETKNKFDLKSKLIEIAAFCAGWLSNVSLDVGTITGLIDGERTRQQALFKAGKIAFDCASPIIDPKRKLRVLFEEGGEVADAIERLELAKDKRSAQVHLFNELVQVAAVCVAWLESLEVQS